MRLPRNVAAMLSDVRHPDRAEQPPIDPALMDLPDLLVHLARALRSRHFRDLAPFDLTPAQARAFTTISRWPRRGDPDDAPAELRLSTLAELLQVAPRSATELVDALQDKGFVQRHPSEQDRRAVVVALSPAGTALRDRMRDAMAETSRRTADDLFAVLDDTQRASLTALLRTVVEAQRPIGTETPDR